MSFLFLFYLKAVGRTAPATRNANLSNQSVFSLVKSFDYAETTTYQQAPRTVSNSEWGLLGLSSVSIYWFLCEK